MAKALHGYLVGSDVREQARLLAENRRLQQRVRDLELQLTLALERGDSEGRGGPATVAQRGDLAPV